MSRWVRGEIEVTSFTLVWIKMPLAVKMLKEEIVTSFTLVWIKIVSWFTQDGIKIFLGISRLMA